MKKPHKKCGTSIRLRRGFLFAPLCPCVFALLRCGRREAPTRLTFPPYAYILPQPREKVNPFLKKVLKNIGGFSRE